MVPLISLWDDDGVLFARMTPAVWSALGGLERLDGLRVVLPSVVRRAA